MSHPAVEYVPDEAECRALVERIIASAELRRANRLRNFLLYAVDRNFAEAPHELTESLIGERVFGRSPMYNTGEDSIVRTEARILRQRLDSYFSNQGADEPIVLEIPKGHYVPVFRLRNPPTELENRPADLVTRRLPVAFPVLITFLLLLVLFAVYRFESASSRMSDPAPRASPHSQGSVLFESSDPQLVRGFEWAKQRALAYTYTGDPVGDWYDSTAGDRHTFCVRDVSHQSIGAAALGLSGHTRNMLRRLASSASRGRNWASVWEINKDGFPVASQDDAHSAYFLPANFDLMRACYRQFLWTGDSVYLDARFSNFYDKTVDDYVAAWDHNRDGVMESSPAAKAQATPSYYQGKPKALIGADMMAAQYAGYLTYAAIQEAHGKAGSLSKKLADDYRARATALRTLYNTEWWNPVQNRHYSFLLPDHSYSGRYVPDASVFALLFGIPEDGVKTVAALDELEKNRPEFDQTLSYYPEVLFQYGRQEAAYRYLLELTDANFAGRGMPEVVFAYVGAIATGLSGLSPDASHQTLETLPRLPHQVQWTKLRHLPVLQNMVSIHHRGVAETSVTNEAGPDFTWTAAFDGTPIDRAPQILVDGSPVAATSVERVNHQTVVFVSVPVKAGQTRTARYVTPQS